MLPFGSGLACPAGAHEGGHGAGLGETAPGQPAVEASRWAVTGAGCASPRGGSGSQGGPPHLPLPRVRGTARHGNRDGNASQYELLTEDRCQRRTGPTSQNWNEKRRAVSRTSSIDTRGVSTARCTWRTGAMGRVYLSVFSPSFISTAGCSPHSAGAVPACRRSPSGRGRQRRPAEQRRMALAAKQTDGP